MSEYQIVADARIAELESSVSAYYGEAQKGWAKYRELEAIGREIVESLNHGQIDLNDECAQKLISALKAGSDND